MKDSKKFTLTGRSSRSDDKHSKGHESDLGHTVLYSSTGGWRAVLLKVARALGLSINETTDVRRIDVDEVSPSLANHLSGLREELKKRDDVDAIGVEVEDPATFSFSIKSYINSDVIKSKPAAIFVTIIVFLILVLSRI